MTQARTTTTTESLVDQVKKLGYDLRKAGTSLFHAGLGVVAATEERVRETFERMVDKGKAYGEDESRLFSLATRETRELGRQLEQRVESVVTATLHRAGVPGREEITQLSNRVEALTRKVDELASREPAGTEDNHD